MSTPQVGVKAPRAGWPGPVGYPATRADSLLYAQGQGLFMLLAQLCLPVSKKHLIIMADDKKNTGKQDDLRVDSNDPSEVEYVHSQFPNKTHQEVKDAIKQYGPMRKDIEDFLNGGK